MKVVLQRVKHASCKVDNKITGQIEQGYLLLVGFTHSDTSNEINKLAKKISNLRIFSDSDDKLNLSLKDVNGKILSISQFTLYADTKKGNRPSFVKAMSGELAIKLYQEFNEALRSYGITVEEGIFGADMQIELLNDGPVTITFEETGE